MSPSLWKATFLVALKELRTSFRDRQTLLYTVVLPIALYPVVFWVMVQGALFVKGRAERTEAVLGLATAAGVQAPAELVESLRVDRDPLTRLLARAADPPPEIDRVRVEPANRPLDQDQAQAWSEGRDEARAPDAVLWLSGREALLFYDQTERVSRLARRRVQTRVERLAGDLRVRAVELSGQPAEALVPFDVETKNIAPERDMLAYVLSFLLPMLLVLMCVMGAFFPAVDMTAGEKERQTSETTLLLPVPRLAIQQGKILAVCATSVLATTLNLTALGLSVGHLLGMLSESFGGDLSQIPVLALLSVAPLALLFSFFVSAILTGIASMAGTFKEGQALLGPVQILFIVPAMVGVIPGLELTLPLACVPVVNVVLAFRGLLLGVIQPAEYALTALSLLLYGLLAIRLAVLILSREGSQLSSRPFSLSRLWSRSQSPLHGS